MRTALLVGLCLVGVPAGMFAWATSAPRARQAVPGQFEIIKASPGASETVTVSDVRKVLGYMRLHPTLCTSRGSEVTCAIKNGNRCTVTVGSSGGGSGSCSTDNGAPLDVSIFVLQAQLGASTQPQCGTSSRLVCIPQIISPAAQATN